MRLYLKRLILILRAFRLDYTVDCLSGIVYRLHFLESPKSEARMLWLKAPLSSRRCPQGPQTESKYSSLEYHFRLGGKPCKS